MRDKKSQNPLTRGGVVLGGAAAMAGVAAAIPKQEPVVAQEASDSRQQISARRLEGKVTVNAVAPTEVRSIRFPESGERRQAAEEFLEEYNALPVLLLEPEDIADSAVFLVSPQAKYITGAVLDVAAGANAKYTG